MWGDPENEPTPFQSHEDVEGRPPEGDEYSEELAESEEDDERREEAPDPWEWQSWQEHGLWLAGRIAARYEEAGIIAKTDQFDWNYHMEFDSSIEAALERIQAPATPQDSASQLGASVSPEADANGSSGMTSGEGQASPSGEAGSGPAAGPAPTFGSDFGGSFGGDFGGGGSF